jgi:hypothetical protein
MYAQDQVIIHTARIIAIQINQCHDSEYIITRALSYYIRLNMTLSIEPNNTTGSRATGTPARRLPRQGTPHHHHLLNSLGGKESKASVSTLMVGTPQVLGTYDM